MAKIEVATIVTDIDYLRKKSKKTSAKEVEKKQIVILIKQALQTGWCKGYGLAAIQIGIPIRAAWYWYFSFSGNRIEKLLINPVILEKESPVMIPGEGCLSLPNKLVTTQRHRKIVYKSDGLKYEAVGIEAQIIQHETDHMDGVLITDREYRTSKVGRNDPCPCGSGKKYKRCCYGK